MLKPQTTPSTGRYRKTRRLPGALALACAVTLLLTGFVQAANAEESLKDGAKHAGHALGTAVHDVGHGAKKVGKEIGHDAKQAGKAVGNAAKEGGREFKRAIKGEH